MIFLSTIIRLTVRNIYPSEGTVFWNDVIPIHLRRWRGRISFFDICNRSPGNNIDWAAIVLSFISEISIREHMGDGFTALSGTLLI